MGMRHAVALDGHADAAATGRPPQRGRQVFRPREERTVQCVVELEEVVYVLAGDQQQVAGIDRPDVEEGEEEIILPDHVSGRFSLGDTAEDAAHGASVYPFHYPAAVPAGGTADS